MIRLNYIDHISPYGVMVRGVGRIHSPFLEDVLKTGYNQYQRVLTLFLYMVKMSLLTRRMRCVLRLLH